MTVSERTAVFVHSADLDGNAYPDDCPFKTDRAGKAREIAASMGLLSGTGVREAPPVAASREEIERFHTPRYLDALQRAAEGHLDPEAFLMGLGTPDCPVFKEMYSYAALATGATLTAARLILEGEANVAFNPSGGYHHAGPEHAAGFCYVNDVALACGRLAEAKRRVAFLDIDVHHADGVQNAFYDRDDVLVVSMHESPKTLFPGTGFEHEIGTGRGTGYTVNVPLPAGTYDEAWLRAFRTIAVPVLEAYGPDVIVMEIGGDVLSGDPLADLRLTNNVLATAARRVLEFGAGLVATGGGGYNVENTARAWALVWSVLAGADGHDDAMSHVGLGGVMMESTDWLGGLRDRTLIIPDEDRARVDALLDATLDAVRKLVFPLHGL